MVIEDFLPVNEDTLFETMDATIKRVVGAMCKLGMYGIKIRTTDSNTRTTRLMEFSGEMGFGFFSPENIEKIDRAWSISAAKDHLSVFGLTAANLGHDIILPIVDFLEDEGYAGKQFINEIIAIIDNNKTALTPLIDRGIQKYNNRYWTLKF